MINVNWEHCWRAGGVAFVVMFIIAYVIYGDRPKVGASADELVSFYDGDRGRVLIASVIFGGAVLFLLWFAAAIASTLRDAGRAASRDDLGAGPDSDRHCLTGRCGGATLGAASDC